MSAALAAFMHIWIPQDEGKAHLQLLQLGSAVQIDQCNAQGADWIRSASRPNCYCQYCQYCQYCLFDRFISVIASRFIRLE